MPSYAIKSSGIRQVAANRLIGNSTGSTGSAQELSATDAKTLLGLGTTDSPQFAKIGIGTAASGSNDITFAPYASISVTGGIVINTDGNYRVGLNYAGRGIQAAKTLPIGWEDATNLGSAASDTKIYRDAAGVIAQRNGTNAQIFRIYNTDDGSQTNYGRASIGWDSNVFAIDVEASGTGAQGTFVIRRAGQSRISFPSNSSVTIHKSLYPSSNGSIYNGWSSLRWSNVYSVKSDISQTLTLASHTPATTTNKLYNVGGTLYFNGSAAGGNPFDQDLNTSDAPTFASATIGNMTLSDVGSYDSITSGDARLALRAQDGSMELYLENASDGNDSFRFNTNNGIFELFSDADNQIDLRNGTDAQTVNIFNIWSDSTNFERGFLRWDSSTFKIGTEAAGTGTDRDLEFSPATGNVLVPATGKIAFSTRLTLNGSSRRLMTDNSQTLQLQGSSFTTSQTVSAVDIGGNFTDADGDQKVLSLTPTYNQSGTAGGTDILVNRTETALGSGTHNFFDFQVGGISKIESRTDGRLISYNANDGAGNDEQLRVWWDSNVARFGTYKTGTGTARDIYIQRDNSTQLWFQSGRIRPLVNIEPITDNTTRLGDGDVQWSNVISKKFTAYNTYTDPSNNEYATFDWSTTANTLTIGTQAAGTGTVRDLVLATGGTETIKVAGSNQRVTISADRTAIGSGASHQGVLNLGGDRVLTFHGGNSSIRCPSGQLDFRTSASVFTLVGSTIRFQGYDGGGFLNIRNYSTGGAGTVVIRKLASQTSDLLKVLDDSGNNLFNLQHTGDFALGLNSTTNPDIYSYGSFTDNSNYERLKIEAGTAYNIRVQAAGTGTGRDLNIHSGASAALRLGVDGTNYIIMTSSGVKPAQDLFPNANNSYKNGTTSNRWSETNTVDLNSTGDINFSGLPTSSSGLSTGDLYLQSSGVPGGDYQIMVKA